MEPNLIRAAIVRRLKEAERQAKAYRDVLAVKAKAYRDVLAAMDAAERKPKRRGRKARPTTPQAGA